MNLSRPGDLACIPFDPLAAPVLADPYPFYAWLRAHDPIHWGVAGAADAAGCWSVTGYDDAVTLLEVARLGRAIERVLPARTVALSGSAAIVHVLYGIDHRNEEKWEWRV